MVKCKMTAKDYPLCRAELVRIRRLKVKEMRDLQINKDYVFDQCPFGGSQCSEVIGAKFVRVFGHLEKGSCVSFQ